MPLIIAASSGWLGTVLLLVDRGASVNAQANAAIRAAQSSGHDQVVMALQDALRRQVGVWESDANKENEPPIWG